MLTFATLRQAKSGNIYSKVRFMAASFYLPLVGNPSEGRHFAYPFTIGYRPKAGLIGNKASSVSRRQNLHFAT